MNVREMSTEALVQICRDNVDHPDLAWEDLQPVLEELFRRQGRPAVYITAEQAWQKFKTYYMPNGD